MPTAMSLANKKTPRLSVAPCRWHTGTDEQLAAADALRNISLVPNSYFSSNPLFTLVFFFLIYSTGYIFLLYIQLNKHGYQDIRTLR